MRGGAGGAVRAGAEPAAARRRVAGPQQFGVQRAQFGARVGAELVGEARRTSS